MLRFNIRVNIGDNNITNKFFFVHKEWQTLSEDKQIEQFDLAVKELNKVYKDYGRFATKIGVTKLFSKYGFEESLP